MTTTSFRFRLEGQPVSWNAAYRNEMRTIRGRGRVIVPVKTSEASMYQQRVRSACERARPRDWEPAPQLRIRYWLYLADSMDADNVLKILNDAIAFGLGTVVKRMKEVPIVNDKRFLPSVEHLSVGNKPPWVGVSIEPFQETHLW